MADADKVHSWWVELRDCETRTNTIREQVATAAAEEPDSTVSNELFFIDNLLTNMLEASSTIVRHLITLEDRLATQ